MVYIYYGITNYINYENQIYMHYYFNVGTIQS